MWTSWIENVVQAFVARRSENELGHNRQDETQNPKVGSEKVVDPQQVPLQALTQQDLLLSQRHELDLQQSAIASAVSRIPQQNRVHPEDIDSGPRIMDMLRTYLGPVMQYPSSSHIQTYAGNRGLPSDQWHDSDRFQPRAKSIDPDLTDRRRMPQEAQLPQQQAYGAITPTRRDGFSAESPRDLSITGQRGPKPDAQASARSRQQDFFDQPRQPPDRENSAGDSGQAQDYLRGRYPSDSATKPAENRYRSRDPTDDRRRNEGRYEEGYTQEFEQRSRYLDRRRGRRERPTGRRDRSHHNDEEDTPRIYRDRDRHHRSYEEEEDGDRYGRLSRKEERGRDRRRQRPDDINERGPDSERGDRHRRDSHTRSRTDEHSPQGGNHTNVVVNVGGVAPTETPAVEASRAMTPPAENSPIVRDAVPSAEMESNHDPVVDPDEAQRAQRAQQREVKRERQERYQKAMLGPSSRKVTPEISQTADTEPTKGEVLAPLPERERDIDPNTSRPRTGAPIPPVDVERHESVAIEQVRTSGPDSQSNDKSEPASPSTELDTDPQDPPNNTSDSARSPRTVPALRGLGTKRKPKVPAIQTQNPETAEHSPVKRNDVLQASPASASHSAGQRTPKNPEATQKNLHQPNLTSPLGQSQESDPTPRRSTSQHRSRRSPASPNSKRHHRESRDLSASGHGRPSSSPHSAAGHSQESEQRGDSDTEAHQIDEPPKTVADEVSQSKPGRPRRHRRRQRVAREVLEYSSTLKAHNVRGPKSLARLIKLALKSSPKVTFLMAVVWVAYVAGILYFGNQVTALEQLTSTSIQPVRRGPEDEIATPSTFSPLESFEKDTQLLIILNLWHANIWLALLFLIDYIWRGIPDPNQDRRHQVWFDRLGFKSLARIMFTFAPMFFYLVLGGRQLTSCAYLLNDPQAIAWSMWPDVALTWPLLSEAAITRAAAGSAIGTGTDNVDGLQLLAVSAFFWGTGLPAFLYTIRRIRHPGLRSKRRLMSKIRKDSSV
jgi:hypothetical protein